jgi:hypothetical protein
MNQEQTPTPPVRSTGKWALVSGGVVLVLIAAGIGYYLSRPVDSPATPGGIFGIPGTGSPGLTDSQNPAVSEPPPIPALPTVATEADYHRSGLVEWQTPAEITPIQAFVLQDPGDPAQGTNVAYKVGKFIAGPYQGADFIVDLASNGPGVSVTRAAKQGQQHTVLAKYSDPFYTSDYVEPNGAYKIDKDFTLSDLELPRTVVGAQPRQILGLNNPYPAYELFKLDPALAAVFYSPKLGQFYITTEAPSNSDNYWVRRNGLYVKAPDGSVAIYGLKPDFFDQADKVPQIIWSDGRNNTQEYVYHDIGGCGSYNLTSVVTSAEVKSADLQISGKNNKGDDIFLLKDPNHKLLKDLYDSSYFVPEGQSKLSYDQFLQSRPLFFWYDPFGRLVKFKNDKYQPLAECAKPVIYLYPQRREQVNVQLWPLGGWLKSEPAYNNGWNVIADPSGTLTNLADNQNYPYLFWEGRGGLYETPSKGFVVAQAEVSGFLDTKLHELGLNNKETADFKEFWLPYMQDAPYYFVTFMGNQTMDQLAPLAITPKPDTIIRVLMDFKPLGKPIPVQGYSIRTPERRGFTVVEWGGVFH